MKNKSKLIKEIISWVVLVFGAFTLAFLINSKAYAQVRIDQSSMENTLFDSQHIVVDELSYNFKTPQHGDIITFYKYEKKGSILNDLTRYIDSVEARFTGKDESEEHERLIKRVIGVEGDVIEIKDGSVYRNGEKLEEPYVKGITEDKGLKTPITVGLNQLFVLGDNRVVSIDSREIGLIELSQVEGKAIFRIYPFNLMGKLK